MTTQNANDTVTISAALMADLVEFIKTRKSDAFYGRSPAYYFESDCTALLMRIEDQGEENA